MAVALIALGAVLAGDRFGWYRLDVAAALAVLLAITGVGLVVGAFIGGGRGLIAPAAVLLVLTIAAAGVGRVHVDGAIGERTMRPSTVAEDRGRLRPRHRPADRRPPRPRPRPLPGRE